MKNEYLSFKSDIKKAKNLGSSAHGSGHWLMQRLTALLIIPLSIWLVYFFYKTKELSYPGMTLLLKQPKNLIPMLMLIITGLYHGLLGMQVVIEDYISCLKSRFFLIIATKLFSFITIFSLIITAIYFLSN